jgi:prepilin-type N-terminal cleavage/methylation domain-containing protein
MVETTKRAGKGFTLVELIVVMGVIAVLSALLLPALQRARRHAVITTCMSRERQLIAAMIMYANDNADMLPRFDNPTGGGNVSDLPYSFYYTFHNQYGVPQSCFFCPAADPDLADSIWDAYKHEVCIGYAIWIPHEAAGSMVPPTTMGPYTPVAAVAEMRGPVHLGGGGAQNPIISDVIYLIPGAEVGDPAQFNFATAPQGSFYYSQGGHFGGGTYESDTIGWVDGHVESHGPPDTHIIYGSYNAWVCR